MVVEQDNRTHSDYSFSALADVGECFCTFLYVFQLRLIVLHLTCICKKYPVITLKDFMMWILELAGGKKKESSIFYVKLCFSFTNFDDRANTVAVFPTL